MKLVDCPGLGVRPVSEFAIAGELAPEPAELEGTTAARWAFERHSVPGARTEWWYHTPTQQWFEVRRETATNAILDVRVARE